MRSKTVLRNIVHPLGADLHLDVCTFLVLDSDVQALVAVCLGIGNPVAQPPGVLLVLLRNEAENFPAKLLLQLFVRLAVDDEADGEHVEDALERHFLHLHLAPYRPGALSADLQFV